MVILKEYWWHLLPIRHVFNRILVMLLLQLRWLLVQTSLFDSFDALPWYCRYRYHWCHGLSISEAARLLPLLHLLLLLDLPVQVLFGIMVNVIHGFLKLILPQMSTIVFKFGIMVYRS